MKRPSRLQLMSKTCVVGMLLSILACSVVAPTRVAAQPQPTYSSRIITGTCDAPGKRGLLELPSLSITDGEATYAFEGIDFQRLWSEVATIVFAEPAVVIVYNGTSVKDSVKSKWVLCGEIDEANSNRDGLGVALGEVNGSAMAGIFSVAPEGNVFKTAMGTIVALENAVVHSTPEPGTFELQHRFIGSRGTCEAPSTAWWQFTPLVHIGPVGSSLTLGEGTQVYNFNGGPHFFSVYDTNSEDDGTIIACGDAIGDERTDGYPEGFMAFRLDESNDPGYVGFVVVFNVGEDVLIRSFVFPGAHR